MIELDILVSPVFYNEVDKNYQINVLRSSGSIGPRRYSTKRLADERFLEFKEEKYMIAKTMDDFCLITKWFKKVKPKLDTMLIDHFAFNFKEMLNSTF